ncbi:MAG: toll/interleukin-1 receptor domain-containing protein [Vicinamibacterales bacterium]
MPAFVPGFEYDVFISYAHQDDVRWVRAFEEQLCEEVSQRLGLPICAWQDTSHLRAGEDWQIGIQQGIRQSAAFVAVVSPLYQNSVWCARERAEFQRQFGPQQQKDTGGRFFKAVKTPWPDNGHRFFLQNIQDVDFYRDDDEGTRDFTPGSREFKRAVRKLADGIEPLLRRMRRGNQRVHVAWPVDECLTAWEELSRELRSKGFDVQPTGPRDASFADRLLMADLDRAVMSVHLLGSTHDPFSERMALLAADLELQMMFWVAPGADAGADARQRAFLDAIRLGVRPDDAAREWPRGWSLIADSGMRRFIDAVLTKLRPQAASSPAPVSKDKPSIYLVHDATTAEDTSVALEIRDRIARAESMEVFVSRSDHASPTEQKLYHENLLKSCDGVLLYRNAAPEGWWNQLAPEVILAERRFERDPIKSRAFLLNTPPRWEVGPDVKVIPVPRAIRARAARTVPEPPTAGRGVSV